MALMAMILIGGACTSQNSSVTTESAASVDADAVASSLPATTPVISAPAPVGTPGSSGIGDELYPDLGNGGYDVQNYNLDLRYNTTTQLLEGEATIASLATQDLSSFNLDFDLIGIGSVRVDGIETGYQHVDGELVVELPAPLAEGALFETVVTYAARPGLGPSQGAPGDLGWFEGETSFVLNEPDGASQWFPVNDHPADKATYRMEVSVPAPYVVASNGVLVEQSSEAGWSTFVWEMNQPMASYLAQLGIGRFDVVEASSASGVPVRDYFDQSVADAVRTPFELQAEMIDFFEDLFGPYPFDEYGALVVESDAARFLALETQTLSVFPVGPQAVTYPAWVIAHELAHQWYGNSLTPATWSDIWLNEGFATYLQWLWSARDGRDDVLLSQVEDAYEIVSGAGLAANGLSGRALEDALASALPPPGAPLPDNLFPGSVYLRGALTLHALRLEVGDEDFFAGLRTYADRFRYGNVATADFQSVMEEVSDTSLNDLFQDWLYEPFPPPIPELGLEPPG